MSKSSDKPSESKIDNLNTAKQHPQYLLLDDINVDLLSVFGTAVTLLLIFVFRLSTIKTVLYAAAVLLPLRSFFPRPTKPQGTVLITGASSGIGAELTYIFANKGHDLVLVGRNEDQLEVVRKKVKTKADVIVTDLSLPNAAQKLYDQVKSKGHVIDVLVNNAGLGHGGDVMEQTEEMTEHMINLNCTALVVLTQLFGKDMISRGRGWILQNSSIGGWMANPGQNIYHATKHFVRAFSEALAIEMRGTGVHITQLMPGPTQTQFATRSHVDKMFIFSSSGSVEDPKDVAEAGYNGLCKNKRMVFSSWNGAMTSTMFQLMPRSLHITLARLANTPTPNTRMDTPKKNQR